MTIKRTLLIALSLVLFATSVVQAQEYILQPKVASFNFLIDDSGSMMMHEAQTGVKKIVLAKRVMQMINQAMPPFGCMMAAAQTFTPFQPIVGYGPYDPAVMAKAINSITTDKEIRARWTRIGEAFQLLTPMATQMAPKSAVVIATDGVNNMGPDPIESLMGFYNANPQTCVHFISFADTAEGSRTIMEMFNLNTCSVMADGKALLNDPVAFNEFMVDVFYTPTEVVDEVMVIDNVLFKFDSSKILPAARPILDEAARLIMCGQTCTTVIGHTDSIGTPEYNMGLSLRRAASVRNYLIKKGVPADRIKVIGKGEFDPEFSNDTAEGRRHNRRVNILLN
ncbi:OmpA family protein [Halodesulfovibrio sp.]|jgi:OOP family OmpA-OmpF porin|uniref:OmpA family protein n=1 Tax=Halodesulfovibrio sp. TaxID=1912772 RepID=UPI0025CEFE5C|nr:OmpA family protein [Halodesulfovibrio sp.]MCT4533890.1 OmpA family protein [Halodesulfovibrio sp.]MCT4628122.1 OmpA family protein [Halodesulfovibrio sp.]